jgi:uncharacterized protein YceK
MKNFLLLALLAGSCSSVMAQSASSQEESGREESGEADLPGGWGLGVGAVAMDSPYAGGAG